MDLTQKEALRKNCVSLLNAYKTGLLGDITMPEDTNPGFSPKETEERLAYFTMPMALNYQRDSFALWRAALATWSDPDTRDVFNIKKASSMSVDDLRTRLTKHKLALQPNKHVNTWKLLAETFNTQWGGVSGLFAEADNDYLKLRELVQIKHKKSFPYLSGPKIFNYWSYIMSSYGNILLTNRDYIEIAPDTHVLQCSVQLGVLTELEANTFTRDKISEVWRNALDGSNIAPIDLHSPLWFWSRGGFDYILA